jgi:CubicO group peptidase (beta-lactamase class C family)
MLVRTIVLFSVVFFASCKPTLTSELDSRLGGRLGPTDPGLAVLVMKDSLVLLEYCRGVEDLERRMPITSSTNFRLASVTKQFTAACVLMLVAEGSLRLDQTLTDIFLHFPPYGKAITVRHLLTHTSGLADYESLMPDTTTVPVHDRDVLRLLMTQDSTLFRPGTQFSYSNSGYVLLALVVEKVSGLRFADFLRTRVFIPLGMTGTVAFEKGISSVGHRAFGHSPDEQRAGAFVQTDQSLTSSTLGDGGIYSSLEDLRRWALELSRPTVLNPEMVREAMRAQVATSLEGESYGYGWYIAKRNGEPVVRHSGTTIGFRNEIQMYPARGITIIVLANRSDLSATDIAYVLADRVMLEEK